MIGKLLGALIGEHIDEDEGGSGVLGAVVGAGAPAMIRGVVRLSLVVGAVYVAAKLVEQARGLDRS